MLCAYCAAAAVPVLCDICKKMLCEMLQETLQSQLSLSQNRCYIQHYDIALAVDGLACLLYVCGKLCLVFVFNLESL